MARHNTLAKSGNSKGQGNAGVPPIRPPRLPYHPQIEERFGVDKAAWKALVEAIFPLAQSTESVILALSYCRARQLDPFKRNVHIVPIWDGNQGRLVDTIWPGIGELRTTAFRTGEYAGRAKTTFGPDVTKTFGSGQNAMKVTFPEWAQVTVYRLVKGNRVEFAGPEVYWLETYAKKKRNTDAPNEMWATRPRGQLAKCAEAAALRAAFPEEVGSDYIAEEAFLQRGRQPQRVANTAESQPPSDTGAKSDRIAEELDEWSGQQTAQDAESGEETQEPAETSDESQDGTTDAEGPQAEGEEWDGELSDEALHLEAKIQKASTSSGVLAVKQALTSAKRRLHSGEVEHLGGLIRTKLDELKSSS